MLEGERRYPGDVRLADVLPFADKLVERGLDVGRVPECDGVQRQAEGAELLFLFLAVGLSDLAAIAVANAAGQAMPGKTIEHAVIGGLVNAPEAGVADIGEPRTELVHLIKFRQSESLDEREVRAILAGVSAYTGLDGHDHVSG